MNIRELEVKKNPETQTGLFLYKQLEFPNRLLDSRILQNGNWVTMEPALDDPKRLTVIVKLLNRELEEITRCELVSDMPSYNWGPSCKRIRILRNGNIIIDLGKNQLLYDSSFTLLSKEASKIWGVMYAENCFLQIHKVDHGQHEVSYVLKRFNFKTGKTKKIYSFPPQKNENHYWSNPVIADLDNEVAVAIPNRDIQLFTKRKNKLVKSSQVSVPVKHHKQYLAYYQGFLFLTQWHSDGIQAYRYKSQKNKWTLIEETFNPYRKSNWAIFPDQYESLLTWSAPPFLYVLDFEDMKLHTHDSSRRNRETALGKQVFVTYSTHELKDEPYTIWKIRDESYWEYRIMSLTELRNKLLGDIESTARCAPALCRLVLEYIGDLITAYTNITIIEEQKPSIKIAEKKGTPKQITDENKTTENNNRFFQTKGKKLPKQQKEKLTSRACVIL